MENPTDRKLQELVDKEAIRDLAVRYCHYVVARDIDGIVGQYSEDADFELPEGLQEGLSGGHGGHDAIRKSLEEGFSLYQPWPFAHNHIIDIKSEDRAVGWLHSEIRMGNRDLRAGMIVSYEDEYVKIDHKWKFKTRKVNATFLD